MNFILMVVLFLIMLAAIKTTNYDFIHPAVFFSILWFVSSFLYLLMAKQWQELCSFKTFVLVLTYTVICVCSMLIGSNMGKHFILKKAFGLNLDSGNRKLKLRQTSMIWKTGCIVLLLIVFYVIATRMMFIRVNELASIASKYDNATNMIYLARIAEINGSGFGRLYITLMRINMAIGIVLAKKMADMIFSHEKGYRIYIPFLLYAMVFSVIRGSRSDLMYILGAYFFIVIFYIYRNYVNTKKGAQKALKYFMLILVVIVALWAASGIVFNRVGASAIQSIMTYVGGPMAGFNYLVSNPTTIASNYFGQNTFDSVYRLLSRFDMIDFDLANIYLPYTGNIHFSINVYTMYGRYISDFGIFGCAILTFIFGLFYGIVYGKIRAAKGTKREHRLVLIYAIFMYPLIMSFFDDRFYSFINNTVLLVIIVLLLDYLMFPGRKPLLFSKDKNGDG